MTYAPPESKREGCYYPNCSGYLEVPFCCHDPKALPALKARLAQLETPKREWVGLTDEERDELLNGSTHIPSRLIDWVEQKLKEKNGAL